MTSGVRIATTEEVITTLRIWRYLKEELRIDNVP
jgi:hypothetical protein